MLDPTSAKVPEPWFQFVLQSKAMEVMSCWIILGKRQVVLEKSKLLRIVSEDILWVRIDFPTVKETGSQGPRLVTL